ncbi:Holliday junction branch migration protein RuvA [Nitrospina watsonii]|uniref:Holliday junction branch migration complex subunit RuvA n=1 Tax=Nitrospina watsonii TaxID=1323948 RepID=A0ABM9HF73_9BACT|nr:Holliday junction branch migration protein RuvA [Nitrospina watsonii]CAI2718886.1 Holliday junction ATP-dependent DNA helicase RuvA [Nitrospina watsonii]
MIAHLNGILARKTPVSVIVDVHGVGYEAFVSLNNYYELPEIGQPVTLLTHTYHKEDTFKLYGFLHEEEKQIFETLIGINKVGPKLALAILSGIPVDELMDAIAKNDIARISTIPGVGRKTAERLVLELKDKLAKLDKLSPQAPAGGAANRLLEDALSALINLGYRKNDAEKALQQVRDEHADSPALETLIKESLNRLS